MRAVRYFIDSNEFDVAEVPIPTPGPNEVLLKCNATSLNPVDAKVNNWKGSPIIYSLKWLLYQVMCSFFRYA